MLHTRMKVFAEARVVAGHQIEELIPALADVDEDVPRYNCLFRELNDD